MSRNHAYFGNGKSVLQVMTYTFLFLLLIQLTCAATNFISDLNLQVQEQLKSLNKPPVKSIQSPDGDIIDCVLAAHQPAFDHPQLKNHVIQMRPSLYPEGQFEVSSNNITQEWHLNEMMCPDGSVAIRRTREDDILRATSVQQFGRKEHKITPKPNVTDPTDPGKLSNHEYAVVRVQGIRYYGAKATISLWQPRVQQADEFSLSQIWITGGSYQQHNLNTIEAGWQVYPKMYGDHRPRLFTYWTRDAYKSTGCYNLVCSGFVQTSKKLAVGASFSHVSTYNGAQFGFTILIWKDPKSGNWWLKFENEVVGYWPSSLFTNIGSKVEWGGEIINTKPNGRHTTTQMGSGHFPIEGSGKASFFKNIQTVDGSNTLREPRGISLVVDHPKCYNVRNGASVASGTFFYYGGPGRNPKCH